MTKRFVPLVLLLLTLAVAGCGLLHPFAGGAGGPNPKPPPPHPTASVTSLDAAIWLGVGMAVVGIVLMLALDQPKRGLGLILSGAATWAGASFLQEFRRPILVAAGVLTLALLALGLWEAWVNRASIEARVRGELAGASAAGSSPAPGA